MCPTGIPAFRRSARSRPATSAIRWPNTPLLRISTRSARSTRFTKLVSIPAEPVPLMGSVSELPVPMTCRSRDLMSSMIARKRGSRCPIVGRDRAWYTSGGTQEGPGPINSTSRNSSRRLVVVVIGVKIQKVQKSLSPKVAKVQEILSRETCRMTQWISRRHVCDFSTLRLFDFSTLRLRFGRRLY